MECLVAICGKDFVMLAADASVTLHGILNASHEHSKFFQLGDHLLMAACGEFGDAVNFAEYIEKNALLYKYRNGYEMGPKAAAYFTREHMAYCIRNEPCMTNLIMGGVDSLDKTAQLYWIDYLGSLIRVPFAWHGYGGRFMPGVFDKMYKPDLSQEDAYKLIKLGIEEAQRRFVISLPRFKVRLVNEKGVCELEDLTFDINAVKLN